jgi:hypothetical protein
VSIPATWFEIDGSPWESDGDIIGASISAAANLDNFYNTYDEPGVFFGVSDDVATLAGYIELLDAYRESFSLDCEYAGREKYEDSAFEGSYDVYTSCSGSSNTLVVMAARPQVYQTSMLVSVFVNIMTDADVQRWMKFCAPLMWLVFCPIVPAFPAPLLKFAMKML